MDNLICYKTMPEWDFNSLPKGFRTQHNTKVGTWAKLKVIAGKIKYYALSKQGDVLNTLIFDPSSDIPFVEPQAWHKVEPISEDLRCQLSFYCQPQDYYQKKYQLSATHSEVLEISNYIQSGKALDMGSGRGRNALFLHQQGFEVTAFDKNAEAIDQLQNIIAAEKLSHINAFVADAQDASADQEYDLILSTVVLMFLQAEQVPKIIRNMQTSTKVGGYNLIVCAMDTEDYPMSAHQLPFGFGFKTNELHNLYKDWQIEKYNEDIGHLHRLDAEGNPIALRFATLIARRQINH